MHPRTYEFGEFRLDALRRVLCSRTDGQPVAVTSKVLDALVFFVERPGQLLEKRALMEALWPNVVVEESNLTQTIHTLRRLLGERPDEHRFIVTVPGRGYRFVAPVTMREDVEQPAAGAGAQGTVVTASPAGTPWHRWLAPGAALVLVSGVILFWVLRSSPPPDTEPDARPAIAVLAFADLSPERDQEYFSDGLSEEILNLLARSQELRVIARTSSFSFKGQPVDIATIAGKLAVTHVLEGSVRKSGDQIRVTAQLVDARTSAHLWSETYDREMRDIFQVQSDIATAVTQALKVRLIAVAGSSPAGTINTQAYERYMHGRYLFDRRNGEDLVRARGYFEEALKLDPEYARAWAGLAGVFYVGRESVGVSTDQLHARWREAVERALALDPDRADAQIRAAQYYHLHGDTERGRQYFERALALNPSDPLVLGSYAGRAMDSGRLAEAIALLRRVIAVDPLSSVAHFNLALTLLGHGQLDAARAEVERSIELRGSSAELEVELVKILVLRQRFDEALAQAAHLPPGLMRDYAHALAYHGLGRRAESDAALGQALLGFRTALPHQHPELWIAEIHAFRGEVDQAFDWLTGRLPQPASIGKVPWKPAELHISPFVNPLRDDPRWQAALAAALPTS